MFLVTVIRTLQNILVNSSCTAKYSKKLNYSFGEIISIIASISTFTIDSIKNEFNIEIESLIESYVSEINNFLNNFFLEEMKDEYFKGK